MAKDNKKNIQPSDRTELIWPGKRKEVERVELPFQTIETINLPRGVRQDELFGRGAQEYKTPTSRPKIKTQRTFRFSSIEINDEQITSL